MAAGLDFEIEGLEELERDLTKAIQTAPEKAKETLKGIGKDFKNAAKKRANSELKPHERTGSEKNKAIKRKWGTKVIEENVGATALVWNSARHFHLIENGHNLVTLKKTAISQCQNLVDGQKVTGLEPKGELKLHKINSFVMNKVNKVVKAGKTPTHTIISNVNDPDAIGAERVAYYGCVIDKMILSDWEAGKTGEESYGFTLQF